MDAEQVERFFIAYLEEMGLSYSLTKKIFTIKLDKTHKKLYAQETDLICTFDAGTAQKKKVLLLGIGVFIIDSIIAKYSDDVVFAAVDVPQNDDDLFAVNENLSTLNETGNYLISEVERACTYVQYETLIKSVKNNELIQNMVLVIGERVIDAKNMVQGIFTDSKTALKLDAAQIEQGFNFCNAQNKKVFDEVEEQHRLDVDALIEIQTEHAKVQYAELETQEKKILESMEQARVNSIGAASFDAKATWIAKMKACKIKHTALVAKNTPKRAAIKKLFDEQIDELSARKLDATVDIKVYAQIHMSYFRVAYDNGNSYFYLPLLNRFIPAE